MKRFLHWSVVPALVALALAAFAHADAAEFRTQPSICIDMQSKNSTGTNLIYLRPIAGASAAVDCSGIWGFDGAGYASPPSYSARYTVSTEGGRLAIQAQYNIDSKSNGKITKVHRMLPVWNQRPDQTKWSKLSRQFTTCAYMSAKPTR